MTRGLVILITLTSCGVSRGALLTNFSASYAKYQACSLLMPASKCYKLYCDPQGIQEGQITAYVDVPDPGPALSRFDMSAENDIIPTHPNYVPTPIGDPIVSKSNGRQRYAVRVHFSLTGAPEPPAGEVLLFELHVHDALPQLGIADTQVGFEFNPGDFVTIFTPGAQPQTTTFDDTQLADVPLVLEVPEPASFALFGWAAALLASARSSRRRRC
jgi:hypothetical protein